jgi:hypothetical protein
VDREGPGTNRCTSKSAPRARREYGPSYFAEKMSGLAAAAKQVAKEQKAFEGSLATEKVQ